MEEKRKCTEEKARKETIEICEQFKQEKDNLIAILN